MILLVTDGVPREAVNGYKLDAKQIEKWDGKYFTSTCLSIHIFPYLKRCACGNKYTEKEFLKLPWYSNCEDDGDSRQNHFCACGELIGWPVRTTDPDALESIWMQA